VIKSMSPLHREVSSFSGATILGDGSVALILDIMQLVAMGQQREARLRAAG
jgi:two-component system chemotaxis sensor kinase CheA